MNTLPPLFLDRLKKILPEEGYDSFLKIFSFNRPLSVRINTLKIAREQVFKMLADQNVLFATVPWFKEALVLDAVTSSSRLPGPDFFKEGYLYPQGLSSMLPALVLDPKPGERVLDLCAAPGSKTTQMACLMQNQGFILAVEPIRERYYKLRSVVSQSGANIVRFKRLDGRRLRVTDELFDKVLVDAPCSSEGRFKINEPKTYAYWSLRKIKEMARKQKGLLLNASRLLKPGGILVYSSCTFAPEENEAAVDWLLRKTAGHLKLLPIDIEGIASYPVVGQWQGKTFHPEIHHGLRVLPDERMEGFFIAKLIKSASSQPQASRL